MQEHNQSDDLQLMALLQQGDYESFDVLQYRYQRDIYSYIYRMVSRVQDAEDLTQKTFLRVWVNRDRFRPQSFKAWLYTIARNLVRDHWRKCGREVPIGIDEEEIRRKASERIPLEVGLDKPGKLSVRNEQLAFIDARLDDILIENQSTDHDRKLGRIKKRSFLLFTDGVTLREIKAELTPVAEAWGVKLTSSMLNNWLSRGDILKSLSNYIVDKYPSWILELTSEQILSKSLSKSEYALIHSHWNEGKTIDQLASEMGISAECLQQLLDIGKQKIKETLLETWKTGIHDTRKR